MSKDSRLVYSTSTESSTDFKGLIQQNRTTENARETDGIVRIHRQTKGRKGNGVSIITGLAVDKKGLKALAKKLKQKLGVGGSVKHDHIELQTNQRQQIKEYLQSQGYQVKIAGG